METYEIVVSVLIVVIVVLVVAMIALQSFALRRTGEIAHEGIEAVKDSFPPNTLNWLGMLIKVGAELASKTPTKLDDEGFKVLAQLFGVEIVEFSDSKAVVARAEPPQPPPAPAPTPPAENG